MKISSVDLWKSSVQLLPRPLGLGELPARRESSALPFINVAILPLFVHYLPAILFAVYESTIRFSVGTWNISNILIPHPNGAPGSGLAVPCG